MDPFHPRLESLPAEIPFFPLAGALLLPGGRLPLNIFEPRYLALVEEALGAGRLFGMVLPDPALPAPQEPQGPRAGLYRVGCLGRIASFAETEDGRFLVTLRGLLRFALREELADSPRGYRRAQVDYAPYAADLAPPPAGEGVTRPDLLAVLGPYFRRQGIEVDWQAVERTSLPLLVTSLCMLCPLGEREKQALLEAPGPADRARLLLGLLRMELAQPGGGADRPS